MPCVGANNTLFSPPPPSSAPITSLSASFKINNNDNDDDESNKITQIPFVKFLIKLLHFFTFSSSSPHPNENEKGTTSFGQQQQQQQHGNTKNDVNENILPPFAYTTAMIFFIQLISVIFVLNIEEFSSPLVMFSYWRNKIS